jgi:hypothetical protein
MNTANANGHTNVERVSDCHVPEGPAVWVRLNIYKVIVWLDSQNVKTNVDVQGRTPIPRPTNSKMIGSSPTANQPMPAKS